MREETYNVYKLNVYIVNKDERSVDEIGKEIFH